MISRTTSEREKTLRTALDTILHITTAMHCSILHSNVTAVSARIPKETLIEREKTQKKHAYGDPNRSQLTSITISDFPNDHFDDDEDPDFSLYLGQRD